MSGKTSHSRFRYRRYGVYTLAYEDTTPLSWMSRIYSLLDWSQAIGEKTPYVIRQLADTIKLAPVAFAAYMATAIWRGVYLAIHLYWSSVLFDRLGRMFADETPSPKVYLSLAASWVCCAMVNVAAVRIHTRSLNVLTKRFRAHFIPRLIRASLRVDLLSIQDLYTVFPGTRHFAAEFPGGTFLRQLGHFVQCTLALTCQAFVLLHVLSRKPSPEREVWLSFCVARGLVRLLVPPNILGCSAYVYWPHNVHFERMRTLYGLAFSAPYRADLMLDGMASVIEAEYATSAALLGDVDVIDLNPWSDGLRREWHWDLLTDGTLDLPMVLSTLALTSLSPSSVASLALVQHAGTSIAMSLGEYRDVMPSLAEISAHAKRLYDAIDYEGAMAQGVEPYPRPTDNASAGMKIAFRHVSLRYPGQTHDALHDVSFDIHPGERILVVGPNGSGKSSLLQLIARLVDPTAGEIRIDDVSVGAYDPALLRGAIAFQATAVVYPGTVRENIACGLPPGCDVAQTDVEEAAQRGGCQAWLGRLREGYDARLKPSFDISQGWFEGICGYPSTALREVHAAHVPRVVSMSAGEKQRLATARTWLRLHHRPTRLLILDEATSALDPIAERAVLNAFREVSAGKTVLVVTHRFEQLVREVDRILCLEAGRVVEFGTHADLVRANGPYAALYHAQSH